MKRENGFALMELMVVLAIAAILLSLAAPALQTFSNNAKQTGAINDFISSMHLARNTAITTNARVTMCASSDGATCETVAWNSGWILFRDLNSNQIVDIDEAIIGSGGAANTLSIASNQYGIFLMYRPSGRVMNATVGVNTGEFIICDGRGTDYAKVIIIDLSGRPKVSKTTMAGTPPACV